MTALPKTPAEPTASGTGTACLTWWTSITGLDNPGARNSGHLAELRRADTILDVVSCPAYHTLARYLPWLSADAERDRVKLDRLAVAAHILAHVRRHDGSSRFGRQMGMVPTGGSTAPVSDLRFRRLVQVSRHEDLMQAMRRTVSLLDNTVNISDLSETILWWGYAPRMKRLAFDYYAAQDAKKKT